MEKSFFLAEKQAGSVKPWLLASRPKTLSASFIPILVATGLAQSIAGEVQIWISMWALMSSILIQIGTNLINDALDFKKGADTSERIGPLRVTQAGLLSMRQVLTGGFLSFALAMLCAIPLISQGGWPIFAVLVLSLIAGYLYTGGPRPLAYYGLGEVFCFLFFGLVSTLSVFYLQTGYIDARALLAGTQMGSLITVLLAINNLRDINSDTKAHKKTLAVRYGKNFARWEIALLALGPYAIGILWLIWDYEFAAWLPFLSFPLAYRNVHAIWISEPSYRYNSFLAYSSLTQFLFSLLFFIGCWLR